MTMEQVDMTSAAGKTDADLPAAAFEAIRPEIDGLPESKIVQVNVEPFTATAMVLGRLTQLRALRSQIQAALPLVDMAQFDKLEQYALAFSHAHGVYRGAHVPKGQIAAMANELTAIRDRLYGDAM